MCVCVCVFLFVASSSYPRQLVIKTPLALNSAQAYDKTARLLGLDLKRGGGPALEQLALEGDANAFNFSVSFFTLTLDAALTSH